MYNILAKNDSYLGFADTLTPMIRGRAKKYLSKKIRTKNGVFERRDFILQVLSSGGKVDYYYSNDGKNADYALFEHDETKMFYEITKTEYDFGLWITVKGYLSEDAVLRRIEEEKEQKKKEEEQAAAEKKAEEEEDRERAAFDDWLNKEIVNYPRNEKFELMNDIFHDLGFWNLNFRTLVLLDHFDDERCKERLLEFLTTHNKGSRKYFECVTGLKLPKTNKETMEFVKSITSADFAGQKPYKKRKKQEEKTLETFYIAKMKQDGSGEVEFQQVKGEKLEKYGLHLFIHAVFDDGEIRIGISSIDCGFRLVLADTKTRAIKKLKEVVQQNGKEKIEKQIYDLGEKYGWTPITYKNEFAY